MYSRNAKMRPIESPEVFSPLKSLVPICRFKIFSGSEWRIYFFDNPFSNGPLTYQDFTDGNFLIVENLQRLKIYDGNLMARLKFKNLLQEKLYLVMCPIYQKRLTFDEFFNVTVSDMQVNDAAKQNEKISY